MRLPAFLLGCALALGLTAQRFYFERLDVQNGLPSSNVYSVNNSKEHSNNSNNSAYKGNNSKELNNSNNSSVYSSKERNSSSRRHNRNVYKDRHPKRSHGRNHNSHSLRKKQNVLHG